tara:strand:- start:113 stop:496 length:384 start_codon:yes stop_codon:yes gene_type:complete
MERVNSLTIYCIYNADGSLTGELAYLFKKYLYGFKCSMCEITYNRFTTKKDWKKKISQLDISLKTVHLDEQPDDLSKFSQNKAPCVVGKNQDGFKLIFTNSDLKMINGDVDLFFEVLKNKIDQIFLS